MTDTSPVSSDKIREYLGSAAAKGMKQVTKGTYAATIDGKDVRIVKLNEIDMKEYTYTLRSGKQIKVRVPISENPPTQAEVEK